MTMKSVMTPVEVAEELHISKRMVYKLIKQGKLGALWTGNVARITAKALEAYLDGGGEASPEPEEVEPEPEMVGGWVDPKEAESFETVEEDIAWLKRNLSATIDTSFELMKGLTMIGQVVASMQKQQQSIVECVDTLQQANNPNKKEESDEQ